MVNTAIGWTWSAAALAVSALASWYDIRTRRIPNQLTLPFWALSVGAWSLVGGWPAMLAVWGASLVAGLVILLPGFRGGGGDLKLAAGLGAGLGFTHLPAFIQLLALGLVMANLTVRFHQAGYRSRQALGLVWLDLLRQLPPVRVPGAPFIGAAALLPWFAHW